MGQQEVKEALTDKWETAKELSERLEESKNSVSNSLSKLRQSGEVFWRIRENTGNKGCAPYEYCSK